MKKGRVLALSLIVAVAAFAAWTATQIHESGDLLKIVNASRRPIIEDRNGRAIRMSYIDEWNTYERKSLSEFPPLLVKAILTEEDKRFFDHHGVDWRARGSAVFSNLKSLRTVRGASTITEQVVRLFTLRPRSLWSKWLEGIEAGKLESKFSKNEILEFYLNQIPFAKNRRGVVSAAKLFFDRDLDTLNEKEVLVLASMIKSPSRLASAAYQEKLERDSLNLADRMLARGELTVEQRKLLSDQKLQFEKGDENDFDARHFVRAVEEKLKNSPNLITAQNRYRTTLDPHYQEFATNLLNEFLRKPARYRVQNGAIVAIDHQTQEVLVWAVGNGAGSKTTYYDPVLIPRQPGSSLKPFLYTLSFEKGLSPASPILDEPFATAVGNGVHGFRNYSRTYYGWISLREALANSLNVPAVKLATDIGVNDFAKLLKSIGVTSLTRPVEEYGEGLALGNGEIPLFEMVQAYSVLARSGVYSPLHIFAEQRELNPPERIFSEEASTLVANVLSDANARRLEFGTGNAMDFPLETAVKTGTSTDYRDAWAFAYNYRFLIGVWMGNLDQTPTEGLTGSVGPMLLARSLMAKMIEGVETKPLPLSRNLVKQEICREEDRLRLADDTCRARTDYFMPGHELKPEKTESPVVLVEPKLVKPTENLRMAVDPRIPRALQVYEFEINGLQPGQKVEWLINRERVALTSVPKFKWRLEKGAKNLEARILNEDGSSFENEELKRKFLVR